MVVFFTFIKWDVFQILQDQDKKAEAEPLYKAAADGRARAFGVDHADTLQAEEALMMCRAAMGTSH